MELNLRDEIGDLFSYARLNIYGKISSRIKAVALYANHESVEEIVERLGYCRHTICTWIHRYNANGIDGLFDLPRPGQPKQLSAENEPIFRRRIIDGPKDTDEIAAFTGKFIIEILRNEFNAEYSLSGVYFLLKRLRLSTLLPRPKHEKNNVEVMQEWELALPKVVEEVQKKILKKKLSLNTKMKADLDKKRKEHVYGLKQIHDH